jgi:hypothetical protein
MMAETTASDGNHKSHLELLKSHLAERDARIKLLEAQRSQELGLLEV